MDQHYTTVGLVQQKLYVMRAAARKSTAVLRSRQRQFVFDDLAKKENINKRIGSVAA